MLFPIGTARAMVVVPSVRVLSRLVPSALAATMVPGAIVMELAGRRFVQEFLEEVVLVLVLKDATATPPPYKNNKTKTN